MKAHILPFERILNLEESNLLKGIIIKASEVFESWGYNYLKLPVFDHFEAHSKALGEKAKEAIVFKTPDSLVTLRSDFTTQVVRSVSFFKLWHFPLRVYYFGTLFSASGEDYERFQTGIELIGVSDIEGDAEVISAIYNFLRSVGLKDLTVSVGHVGIVEGLLRNLKEKETVKRAFREKNITALKHVFGEGLTSKLPLMQGREEVLGVLDELGLSRERKELEKLGRLLEEEGVSFVYDLSEVRDFPYYTGIVFEIFAPELGSPVAGGGRYDRLSEVYGERFPATGGTVYVESLFELLDPRREEKDFFVIDVSNNRMVGFKIASYLRKKGYKTGRDMVRRGLEHSLDYAFGEGYRRAVVILDEESVRLYTTVKDFEAMSLKDFLKLF